MGSLMPTSGRFPVGMPGTPQSSTLADLRLRTYRILEDMSALDSILTDIAAVPASGNIFVSVNDPSQWPVQSRMEIDDEMFLVVGDGTNPISVSRAYESSFPQAHKAGSLARRDPRFQRLTVTEAINVVIGNWCSFYFPQLVWDELTAGSFTPVRWFYQVPADTLSVRRVTWQLPGFQRYVEVDHSEVEQAPPSAGLASGYGFEVHEKIGLPGRPVICLLEKRWPDLILETDSLPSDFPPEADDLIPMGAALYIAGIRNIPRYRLDEITFYREQNSPLPSHFSEQWLEAQYKRWYLRAKEVAGKRPNQSPQKIYVGAVQNL